MFYDLDNDKTDHITSGIYSILSFSFMFDLYQKLIGDDNLKMRFVREFVTPKPAARILDIGCGTGSILDFLPVEIEYIGYDLNWNYIQAASKKYKNRGKFNCQRVNDLPINDHNSFDIVLAKGILHHINDEESKRLFEVASCSLKPGGYLVTLDGAYIKNQSKIAKYIISKDRGKHVRTLEEYTNLANSCFSKVETFILHDAYRIPYTILIMKCYRL